MRDFQGKVAFITGGASGAGFGQAQVFGEAGCKILIADIRKRAINKAVAQLRASGIDARGIQLDVTARGAFARAADEVEQIFGGPPQLLFNTAGVNSYGPAEVSTYDDFDWLLGVNLGGVVNGMVTFVPRMIRAGREGYIVTTSSVGGFHGSAAVSIYSAAKAAVISLMESYKFALEKYNIGVSVLCPANIKSNIAEAVKSRPRKLRNTAYKEDDDSIAALHSIHRHGMEPVELAQHTKRAIEADQLYIVPYPEVKERLQRHFQSILDAIPPVDSDPEGVKQRTESLQNWARERTRLFTPAAEHATGQEPPQQREKS